VVILCPTFFLSCELHCISDMLALAVSTHKGAVQYTHKSCNNTQEYM
jgi:hypothetical protein